MATSTSGLTSISGLSSGIDTSSLVTSLMQIAAGPQNLLKTKLASTNTALGALQSLNTQAASLATAATALTKPAAYAALTASSTSTATTTTTTASTASAGSLTFDVTQLATRHSVIGDPWTSGSTATSNPSVQVLDSGGHAVGAAFTAASDSPTDLAAAINGSGGGLSATVVSSSDGSQRLVVTSAKTGAASEFSLSVGGSGYGTTLSQAQDAKIRLSDTDRTTITSPTNTFTGLMTGVDVTVSKVETGTTVSVASDTSAVTASVKSLVSQLNVLVGNIAVNTQAKPGSAGSAASTSPLTGESTVLSLRNTLLTQLSGSVGGLNPAQAGISVDRDGNATFDAAVFTKLLATDPAKAQSVISALAGQVATTAKQASDPYAGSLSLMIKGEKAEASSYSDAIDAWTDRLTAREAALKAQFAAMETALSNLSSQSSALTASLKSLSSD